MPSQSYFSPEAFLFLSQLKKNNRRPWFLKNKARYEAAIKEPCIRFVTELAPLIQEISPYLESDPRSSLFRIYRDIRFSADKKPYKTHVGMQFHLRGTKGGKSQEVRTPGYYLHLEPGDCGIYAGMWHPDNKTLLKIREAIVAHPDAWKKAMRGFELIGDKLSRPPRGFPADHPHVEHLKHKDFMVTTSFTEKQICSPDLAMAFAKECRKMAPLVKFLADALSIKM